jgi:hypothetical protein
MGRKFTPEEIAGFDEEKRRRIAKCRRYYAENRERLRKEVKAYQVAHRDQIRTRKIAAYRTEEAHRKYLDKTYGLGAADHYYAQLKKQRGKCAICGAVPKRARRLGQDSSHHPWTERLAQDHEKDTQYLRGLICPGYCNRALGYAREDPAILRKMADYIELWQKERF